MRNRCRELEIEGFKFTPVAMVNELGTKHSIDNFIEGMATWMWDELIL